MGDSVTGVNASIRPMPSDSLPSDPALTETGAADPMMPPIQVDPLPYEAHLALRASSAVDLVVIHCTELPDLATARRFGEEILYPGSQTGNSGHYYIDRDGALHQFVSPGRVAHHTRGYNPRSIGIELVNLGRYPGLLGWTTAGEHQQEVARVEAGVVTPIGPAGWDTCPTGALLGHRLESDGFWLCIDP